MLKNEIISDFFKIHGIQSNPVSRNIIADYNDLNSLGKWGEKIHIIRNTFNFYDAVNLEVFTIKSELETVLGKKLPEWIVGVNRSHHIYLLLAQNKEMLYSPLQLLVHEFSHIAIRHRSNGTCPLWLSEGIALHVADQSASLQLNFNYIPQVHSINSLDYNNPFFYPISAYITDKIINEHGLEKILSFIAPETNYSEHSIIGSSMIQRIMKMEFAVVI